VDRSGRLAHRASLERLAAAQQFAVDFADILENLAASVIIGEKLGRLPMSILRDAIHLRPLAGIALR
jgi:hypothetical protein